MVCGFSFPLFILFIEKLKKYFMSEKLQQDSVPVSPRNKAEEIQYLQGRGAQFNTKTVF